MAGKRPGLPGLSGSRDWLGAVGLSLLLLAGCAGPPRPLDEPARRSILSRLQDRKRLITSAVYRVRWQAKGTEPHGEFFLEIAYKAPDRYRVSATGPFGIPAFTAVILGEEFWFLDHKDGKLLHDDLWNLEKYDIPLSSFFADYWRDLFAGGWGPTELVTELTPTNDRDVFQAATDHAQWTMQWNAGKQSPRKIVLDDPGKGDPLTCTIWLNRYEKAVPFWHLDRLEFRSHRTGGLHRWKILKQDYGIDIPERLFEPLRLPTSRLPGNPR